MNITDFNIEIPTGDKLEIIFNHQISLMNTYHDIEEHNLGRHLPRSPINLDDPQGQQRLKDFAWRITEELAEATSCLGVKTDEVHYLEELIDALHFSVEFYVMSGLTSRDMSGLVGVKTEDKLEVLFALYEAHPCNLEALNEHYLLRHQTWLAVEKLGEAMNCLKNKPWKSTHIITDKNNYRECVLEFHGRLIKLLSMSGFNPLTVTQSYLNKNAVNQFRIRSNY